MNEVTQAQEQKKRGPKKKMTGPVDEFGGKEPTKTTVVSMSSVQSVEATIQPASTLQKAMNSVTKTILSDSEARFEARFVVGLPMTRVMLKEAVEIQMLGAETNLYASKGPELNYVPLDGVYGKYKGKSFFIPASNIKGCWL